MLDAMAILLALREALPESRIGLRLSQEDPPRIVINVCDGWDRPPDASREFYDAILTSDDMVRPPKDLAAEVAAQKGRV